MFINGLPVSSLFCYTALLYLHHCLHAPLPYALCSSTFYALCAMSLLCTIPLLCISAAALYLILHTWITLNNTQSLLCSMLLFSLCIFCILYSQCFCMLSPCRVLFQIIIVTLQFLWRLNPCIHHHWVLFRDSFASPTVETLHLLCYSRAQTLCCSYRLQCSPISQSPLSIVFIPLANALRLFSFSGKHPKVSSSPLIESISCL